MLSNNKWKLRIAKQKATVEQRTQKEEKVLGHISASSLFSNANEAITLSCVATWLPRRTELSLSKLPRQTFESTWRCQLPLQYKSWSTDKSTNVRSKCAVLSGPLWDLVSCGLEPLGNYCQFIPGQPVEQDSGVMALLLV